jgi:hypothetical protein
LSHADHHREQRALLYTKMASSSVARPATNKELLAKRDAIWDERPDTKLGMQDKAVYQYREERVRQYWSRGQSMSQDAFNKQYYAEQFTLVMELLEKGDDNHNNGDGSAGQERR